MGNCIHLKRNNQILKIQVIQLQYSRQGLLKIKNRNRLNEEATFTSCAFHLPEPTSVFSKSLPLNKKSFQVSFAVLPGLNPRHDIEKVCQDVCFTSFEHDSLLVGLYDGHGSQGEHVVEFCSKTAQNLHSSIQTYSDPIEFLQSVTLKCETALNESNIDTSLSGCTQVLVLVVNDKIYCASLGDSRAVLATSSHPALAPVTHTGIFHQSPDLKEVKQRRNSSVSYNLNALQLTFDQKPDLPEELARIKSCGGRVDQIKDSRGKGIGPYRVWEQESNTPGISVSRALGDLDSKKIGVISEPICSSHSINETDFFLVVASDGVWDVMNNEEVANFVECNRLLCKRNITSAIQGRLVNPENSCIAQILCEEARVRWFSIVKEEDVNIDDISCIVIELKDSKTVGKCKEIEEIKVKSEYHDVNIVEVSGRDNKRGSLFISSNMPAVDI